MVFNETIQAQALAKDLWRCSYDFKLGCSWTQVKQKTGALWSVPPLSLTIAHTCYCFLLLAVLRTFGDSGAV
jgi:hypothetical protein